MELTGERADGENVRAAKTEHDRHRQTWMRFLYISRLDHPSTAKESGYQQAATVHMDWWPLILEPLILLNVAGGPFNP